MYLLLIHSSVFYGHLVCFHVLTIVNSAAVNIGMHVSFQIMFFSRYTACILTGKHSSTGIGPLEE